MGDEGVKTIVIQGWEPIKGTPDAVKMCMNSVKENAKLALMDYRLIDDGFFAESYKYMPEDHWSVLARASYSRNYWALQMFAEGFDRVIWIDSDIPIRSPLAIQVPDTLHVTLEPHLYPSGLGFQRRQNDLLTNSALKYTKAAECQMFFEAQKHKIANIGKESYSTKTALGTDLYTALGSYTGCDYFTDIAFATSSIRDMLVNKPHKFFDAYVDYTGRQPLAVNLCGSLLDDKSFTKAAANFLEYST